MPPVDDQLRMTPTFPSSSPMDIILAEVRTPVQLCWPTGSVLRSMDGRAPSPQSGNRRKAHSPPRRDRGDHAPGGLRSGELPKRGGQGGDPAAARALLLPDDRRPVRGRVATPCGAQRGPDGSGIGIAGTPASVVGPRL